MQRPDSSGTIAGRSDPLIKEIPHPQSEGLRSEIAAQKKNQTHGSLDEKFAHIRDSETYCREFVTLPDGLEVIRRLDAPGPGKKILEIGPGAGQLALYLAHRGFSMSVVEPSPELCEIIEYLAHRFGLRIAIYRCAAEYADRIGDTFDFVIFNSSLHHCDEPETALKNCRQLLKEGGEIVVANEPILHFFRSKRWFSRRLRQNPQAMGHYGGNEHSYHYPEYVSMLTRSGFSKLRSELNVRYIDRKMAMAQVLHRGVYDRHRVWMRRVWFFVIGRILRTGKTGRPLISLMKNLSLLTVTFLAEK